jgi:hypothetical protein
MRLKSRTGPATRLHVNDRSPEKVTGSKAARNSSGSPSPERRTPPPVNRTNVRSTPANGENGPSCSMSATLTRHANEANPDPGGCAAISVVVPPPFFHGIRR